MKLTFFGVDCKERKLTQTDQNTADILERI